MLNCLGILVLRSLSLSLFFLYLKEPEGAIPLRLEQDSRSRWQYNFSAFVSMRGWTHMKPWSNELLFYLKLWFGSSTPPYCLRFTKYVFKFSPVWNDLCWIMEASLPQWWKLKGKKSLKACAVLQFSLHVVLCAYKVFHWVPVSSNSLPTPISVHFS